MTKNLKTFIHGSAVSMAGVVTLGVMNYLIRRILSLNLSEIEYGFIYSAFGLVMLLMVFLDLGLGQSITVLMSKSFTANDMPQSNKIFTLTLLFKVLLAFTAFAVIEALSPFLARYYFKYPEGTLMLMVMMLLIPAVSLESTFLSVIGARKAFSTQQILANLKVFIIFAGIFLGAKKYGLNFSVICFVAGSIITGLLAWLVVKSYGITLLNLKTVELTDFKAVFSLSSWIAISTAAISIMYWMDTICLTGLEGLKSVAMYNIALPIMQIAQSFFVFPAIFTPFVSEMWHNKDYKGIRRTCIAGSFAMLMTLPVFLVAGLYFASDIISLLFAAKYKDAAPAVTILWCGMVFFSIASFNINALNSGFQQKKVAYMAIVCTVVNLVLNFILIPKFSYIGAALATAITYLILAFGAFITTCIVLNKKLKI
jgi:O-antigen/teichoic acid export membrane protein